MTQYEFITIIIFSLSSIAALIMIGVTVRQLHHLVKQAKAAVSANDISRLTNFLSLEDMIADRRHKLSEAGISLAEMNKTSQVAIEILDAARLRFDEAVQMYLNSLDRLCYCLKYRMFNDTNLLSDYREVLKCAITDFPDQFKLGTEYRNIVYVFEHWTDIAISSITTEENMGDSGKPTELVNARAEKLLATTMWQEQNLFWLRFTAFAALQAGLFAAHATTDMHPHLPIFGLSLSLLWASIQASGLYYVSAERKAFWNLPNAPRRRTLPFYFKPTVVSSLAIIAVTIFWIYEW